CDVPEHLRTGQVDQWDGRDDDGDGPVGGAGVVEGRTDLFGARSADGLGAESRGDLTEVDVEVVAGESGGISVTAVAEVIAELLTVLHHLQPADDLESVILRDHIGDVEVL